MWLNRRPQTNACRHSWCLDRPYSADVTIVTQRAHINSWRNVLSDGRVFHWLVLASSMVLCLDSVLLHRLRWKSRFLLKLLDVVELLLGDCILWQSFEITCIILMLCFVFCIVCNKAGYLHQTLSPCFLSFLTHLIWLGFILRASEDLAPSSGMSIVVPYFKV